ncbi:MAG: hypothetical protein ABW154_11370, partial [Dyella sp.]
SVPLNRQYKKDLMKKCRLHRVFVGVSTVMALSLSAAACASTNELYLGLGTTGIGAGYAYGLNDTFALRGEFDGYSYSGSYNSNSTRYDGRLHLQSAGIYGDWFPLANGFRVTAGVVNTNNKFSGHASGASGTVNINHVTYSLAGESADISLKFPSNSPYLGLGWGHNPSHAGWGWYGDVGLQFGTPKSVITLSPGLATRVPASDVTAAERTIDRSINVLGGYPVISMGVSYHF